jgi:predicted DsbA family dithiol-disulfide isomerase
VTALTAVKCAELQGAAAFERLHGRLFPAHFRDQEDIGRPDVLWRLADESGLDMARYRDDWNRGDAYRAMLHDYAEGAAWFGVSALPTVVFDEKLSLVGAVPEDRYRAVIDWILAGSPGGVIPIAPGPSTTPSAEPR